MLIGYACVSTHEQSLDLQQDALQKAGCERTFTDVASGAIAERDGLSAALILVSRIDPVRSVPVPALSLHRRTTSETAVRTAAGAWNESTARYPSVPKAMNDDHGRSWRISTDADPCMDRDPP